MRQKRVLLADDNPDFLSIVRELLVPEFEVVGACTDGDSVLQQAASLRPDIVVLDVSMGEPDGIAVARELRHRSQHLKIVFLTVHELADFVRTALGAGAAAYVFKSQLNTDLLPAIHAACSGRMFISCRSS